MNTELYFSFGSNMDHDQMKKRTPLAEYRGIGRIRNYDLVFNRKGTYRSGGVASIIPKDGVDVYGVLWAISPDELRQMDQIEDPDAYQRVQMIVTSEDGDEIPCHVYVSYPEGDIPADQPYLETILSAAASAGLPDEWIERIGKYRIPQ